MAPRLKAYEARHCPDLLKNEVAVAAIMSLGVMTTIESLRLELRLRDNNHFVAAGKATGKEVKFTLGSTNVLERAGQGIEGLLEATEQIGDLQAAGTIGTAAAVVS